MITNDFIKELSKVGITVMNIDLENDEITLRENDKDSDIKINISKIRKIFLNSLLTYIDNTQH